MASTETWTDLGRRSPVADERGGTSRRVGIPLTVQTVTTPKALDGLAPDYERLLAVSDHGLPFGLHAWHMAWWSAFHKGSAFMEDRLHVKVFRAGPDCVGIVPLVVTSRPRTGALRLRGATLLGADPYLTELKVPLLDPDYAESVAVELARDLAADDGWDWIHWTGLRQDDAFGRAFVRAAGLDVGALPPVENFLLDLPPTWEEFTKGLKRNIRESLRHGYNSLKRDGHVLTLEVITRPERVPQALATFHALHGARADLEGTVAHPDRFPSEASKSFLADVCERLSRQERLRIFVLKIGGAPVAIRIGFVVGSSLYLYYSGYDPAWGRYGVMTTCVAEAVRWGIENGVRTVNLSAGRDVSKTRWGAREVTYLEAIQVRDRPRSRLARGFHVGLLRLRDDPRFGALVMRVVPRRAYW